MRKVYPGYTLIELMIVVILIGIVTAIAAPQVGRTIAETTVAESRNETVMMFRASRTAAAQHGGAYGVFISSDSQLVRLDRGADNTCLSLPTCNNSGPSFGGADCGLKALDLTGGHFVRRGVEMDTILVEGAEVTNVQLCVTPRGRMFEVTGTGQSEITVPVEVTFHRVNSSGTRVGVPRTVLINSSAMPRVLQ